MKVHLTVIHILIIGNVVDETEAENERGGGGPGDQGGVLSI